MLRWPALAWLVVVAGCNAVFGLEPVTGGDPIVDAPTDDDGRPLLDAAPDAPDGPSDDVDSDGRPNAADNCPAVANPHQDDDDGDGLGDVCDLCPHLGGLVMNLDGDGLGDSCGDPSTTAAQCIVWFDGFLAARTWPQYVTLASHGTWSFGDGAARQTDSAVEEGLLYLPGRGFPRPLVLSHAIVTDQPMLPTGEETWELGVWSYLTPTTEVVPDGVMGNLTQKVADPLAYSQVRRHQAPDDFAVTAGVLRAIPQDLGILLGIDTRTGVMASLVKFDDGAPQFSALATYNGNGDSRVGLRTHNLGAQFDYLLVVTDRVGPTCPVRVEP